MRDALHSALQQSRPFGSPEEAVVVALQVAAARTLDPWARHLKARAQLTPVQYNVLRILRGAAPGTLTCGQVAERMITRDSDITRLLDRLAARGLVHRARGHDDRRVVHTGITPAGLAAIAPLDADAKEQSRALLSFLGRRELLDLSAALNRLIAGVAAHDSPLLTEGD